MYEFDYFMFKNLKKNIKKLGMSVCKSFYYSMVIAFLIMQVACSRVTQEMSEKQAQKAAASLPYGKNPNRLIASRTGALFY